MSAHKELRDIEKAINVGDAITLPAGKTLTVKNSAGTTLFSIDEATGAVTASSGDETYAVLPIIGGPTVDQYFFYANRAMTIVSVKHRFTVPPSVAPTYTIYAGAVGGNAAPAAGTAINTGNSTYTANIVVTPALVSTALAAGGWLGIGLGGGSMAGANGVIVVTLRPA